MELDPRIKTALDEAQYAYSETYSKRRIIVLNTENCLVLPPEEYFNYSVNNEDDKVEHYYIDGETVKIKKICEVYRYNNIIHLKNIIGNSIVKFNLVDGGKEKERCLERILIYDFKNKSNPFMEEPAHFFKDNNNNTEMQEENIVNFIYDNIHDVCQSEMRASYDKSIIPLQHHIFHGTFKFPKTDDFTLEDVEFSCYNNDNLMIVSSIGITNFLTAINEYILSVKTVKKIVLKKQNI